MSARPLVTVGIPIYNRPDLLQARLSNVIAQTYRDIEIIVSDNASPNPEVERIGRAFAERDSRIHYIRQPENLGATGNFSFLVEAASGKFFVWAADDDQWSENFIEVCVDKIGSAQLFCVEMETVLLETGERAPMELPALSADEGAIQSLRTFLAMPQSSMVYGLHRLADIKPFMQRGVYFDLWDIALLYDVIVNKGISVGTGAMYSAGLSKNGYTVMQFGRKGSRDRLSYRQFFRSIVRSTTNATDLLTPRERCIAVCSVTLMTMNLIRHLAESYPDKARRHHRMLASAFKIANRLKAAHSSILAIVYRLMRKLVLRR